MKLENPILNSPFEIPSQYWALDDAKKPTGEIVSGRRRSEYIVPIATSKRKSGGQEELVFTDVEGTTSTRANAIINEIRKSVEAWRSAPGAPAGATYETSRLLLHWRDQSRERPLFYCQVEAAETVIWLTEVAAKNSKLTLHRICGETVRRGQPWSRPPSIEAGDWGGQATVIAMLIAWHAINKARRPNSKVFSDAFTRSMSGSLSFLATW